jgi:CCR4-NOT transcription complex subunit 2
MRILDFDLIALFVHLLPASPQFMNMLGSSYPTPGASLSQNQMQAGNSSLGSSGMLRGGSSSDTPFDLNDFPQLTGRPNSAGGGQGQYGNTTMLTQSSHNIVLTTCICILKGRCKSME